MWGYEGTLGSFGFLGEIWGLRDFGGIVREGLILNPKPLNPKPPNRLEYLGDPPKDLKERSPCMGLYSLGFRV